ncbi:HAMP domain-containing protein [Baekduia soli]|uniref:histidine kinase n=1 Tax=Baekduia soli TaxID=496014 RepID=A0A5B8U4C5_9ACTN|nr:HAMP domain-containing sensor histidine kinase [Baekduia soli]QEC47969.1 HAMP domain-containing protein [Baekduia soli]
MSLRVVLGLAGAYVVLLAVVALEVPLGLALRDRVDAEVRAQASAQASIVAATAGDLFTVARRPALRALARRAAAAAHGRVLVVDARGVVLVDSAGPAAVATSYASRPEIAAALRGSTVQDTRRSQTLGRDLLATASPAVHDGRTVGAVRVTQSVAAVHRAVRRSWVTLGLLGLAVLLLAAAVGALVAGRISRPLGRLQRAAEHVAAGDLTVVAEVDGTREQQSLARSFNEMTARLSRLLRSHHDFVADASHQLRTPLTALRLRLDEADAALQAGGDPEAARRELRAATAEADRLTKIITELLLLTRAPGTLALREPVDPVAVVRAAAARWEPAAAARGMSFAVRAEPGPAVLAAPADLDRVLDALVENALAYAPPGTTVTLGAGAGAIHVEDEGPGVDPDEAEAVFGRFHRGRAGRATPGGSGLGLAIARELAARWDATVALAPRRRGGTRATITLVAAGPGDAPWGAADGGAVEARS